MNTWQRKSLAIAATLLLAVPSALGVYRALEPIRGALAAGCAAAGFEAIYLATAVLILTPELQRYARNVALCAVASAVLLNTLADYAARVPNGLGSSGSFLMYFDVLALALALAESLPMAGLAYAMASLLHKLSVHEVPCAADLTHAHAPHDTLSREPDRDILSIAQLLRDQGVSWREIGQITGVSDATIRRKLNALVASNNGAHHE